MLKGCVLPRRVALMLAPKGWLAMLTHLAALSGVPVTMLAVTMRSVGLSALDWLASDQNSKVDKCPSGPASSQSYDWLMSSGKRIMRAPICVVDATAAAAIPLALRPLPWWSADTETPTRSGDRGVWRICQSTVRLTSTVPPEA